MEEALTRLSISPANVLGAGRSDAGVHARGQAAGVRVPPSWQADTLRKALNAVLPGDIWVAAAHEMQDGFHARYSATSRRYSYYIGVDEAAASPFRRRYEWHVARPMERTVLDALARQVIGRHGFRAFAVRGTAPPDDDHQCDVYQAGWHDYPGGLRFEIEANRFLHHMVRFLIGTMTDVALGRRGADDMRRLLDADDNSDTSPPAPAHALFLDRVVYPAALYRPAP
jgi:tRNA pseudouridine38-40 synthase